MALLMEMATGGLDPDQVRLMRTPPSRIDRLAAGVADRLPVSLGRPVDDGAVLTDRVNQTPERRATTAQAISPMRAVVRAPGRNRMK